MATKESNNGKWKATTYMQARNCLHLSRKLREYVTQEKHKKADNRERYDLKAAPVSQQREVQYAIFYYGHQEE